MAARKWLPLVSEPEVFTRYAAALGCTRVQGHGGEGDDADVPKIAFCDVFGLDPDLLMMVPRPVMAVVLLFPIEKQSGHEEDSEGGDGGASGSGDASGVFFVRQKIANACGTIALLHAVANNQDRIPLKDGSFLGNFVDACAEMDPDERAAYLDAHAESGLEGAHNAAACSDDSRPSTEDMDTDLHFICYVQRDGKLWELDGRNTHGARAMADCAPDDLLEKSAETIRQRMARTKDLRFNIIALTSGM